MLDLKALLTKILTDPKAFFTVENYSISIRPGANTYKNGNFTITKSGYYPLALAGWAMNTTWVFPCAVRLGDQAVGSGKIYYEVRNTSSAAQTNNANVWVVWIKAS